MCLGLGDMAEWKVWPEMRPIVGAMDLPASIIAGTRLSSR